MKRPKEPILSSFSLLILHPTKLVLYSVPAAQAMEGRRSHLAPMPDNYISLRHLQEKRLKEKEEERRRRLIEQGEEERRRRLIEQDEEERKKLAAAVEALVLGGSGDQRQGGEDRTICREGRVSEGEEKRGGGEEGVPAVATARKMGWKKKRMRKKKGEGAVALVVAGDGETAAIGPCTADLAVPGWKTKAGSGDTARLTAAAAELKIGGSREGEDAGVVAGKGGEGRKEAKGKRWGQQAKSTAAVVVGENSGGRRWAEKGEEVRSEAKGKGRGQPAKSPAAMVGEEGGQSEWAEKGDKGRSEAKRQGRGRPAKSPAATMEAALEAAADPAATMVAMPVATTAVATATVGERGGRKGWAMKGARLSPRPGDDVGQMWVPKCGGTESQWE